MQGVDREEGEGDSAFFTIPPDRLDTLKDKGALHTVADRELRAVDRLPSDVRRELGRRSVKGKRQQFVFVPGRVDSLKAELLCKRLVGEPGLLFFCPEHADARLALSFGVGQAVLHQRPPVPPALAAAVDPQAVEVDVVVAEDGDPGRLKGRVFDENHRFRVELPEHMALLEPGGEPLPLRLDARMGLLAADDAAEMLFGEVLLRQVYKIRFHTRPRFQLIFAVVQRRKTPFPYHIIPARASQMNLEIQPGPVRRGKVALPSAGEVW